MGHRFDPLPGRQRPDLIATRPSAAGEDGGAADAAVRMVVLMLLGVDGVLSALAGALLLPSYVGVVPFPVSGLISGLVNAALVWAAGLWARSPRVAAVPLWTWLITVAFISMGGPADDVILGGEGLMRYGALLLMVLGVSPPAWVLWRRGPHC
ncbi:hypothetical protein ACOJVU_18505 [Mycobacterium sp. THU-M104]|uniref:hypothetical protein n=1 Tax=Mycobacterium sp. THU-M104 TaxID=3410515 RepID=UPI003B9C2396